MPELIETREPWPDPVDGTTLAAEVLDRVKAHVIFASPHDAHLATLWIIGTYLMDRWRLFPRLMVTSPEKACGKTTLLEVLETLVLEGRMQSNITMAAIFRMIGNGRLTLLLDEADTFLNDNPDMIGVLNSGHSRSGAVTRCQAKTFEIETFKTFCPAVIAGIGKQRDTITSRSIVIGLRRKLPGEMVERLPIDLLEQMEGLRSRIARWAEDNGLSLAGKTSEPPECGNDRRHDNYTPLWRIAEQLGGRWPGRVAAAYAEVEEDDDESAGVMLLRDLVETFDQQGSAAAKSETLVSALNSLPDRPWLEWRRGQSLNARALSELLKPFGIRPTNMRIGGLLAKGYRRTEVDEAFARYCSIPPTQAVTPVTSLNTLRKTAKPSVTVTDGVTDENAEKRNENNNVTDVTAKSPLQARHSLGDFQ